MYRILAIMLTLFALSCHPAMAQSDDVKEEIVEQQPQLKAAEGRITLSVGADASYTFYIFSITGQLLKRIDVSKESVDVELPSGCYIVKCTKWSKKVIVK